MWCAALNQSTRTNRSDSHSPSIEINAGRNDRATLGGDKPKTAIEDDEFGLSDVVRALSETVGSDLSPSGYVLGVEGAWGSGKSSYANFVAQRIEKAVGTARVLRFDPWLIGERTAFLSSLLGQLASEISLVEDAITPIWRADYWLFWRWRSGLAAQVRTFGKYAAALATPIQGLAIADPTAATQLAAMGLKGVGRLASLLNLKTPGLADLKARIVAGLKKLERKVPKLRFVVIVDDTDRLEPAEAVEILRLIKHAADFPLVIYIVCYDEKVLSDQVAEVLQVSDARAYLEKIFQTVVPIPPHEPFALRRYARKLLASSFPEAMKPTPQTENVSYRENITIDYWAGVLLKTPRDVVRLLEAVTFGWRWLPLGADFMDFVWLQLVKLKAPDLYKWVQLYLTNVAAYRDGGRPTDGDERRLANELFDIMQKLGWTSTTAHLSGIDRILPGVSSFALDDERRKVFEFSSGELARYEQSSRLGSPSHWRNYFAFAFPTYAITDEELAQFRRNAAQQDDSAASTIIAFNNRHHSRRGHFVDVLLDRIGDLPTNSLSSVEQRGVAEALAATMDEVAATRSQSNDWGSDPIWSKATRLIKRTDSANFEAIVTHGASLNWIAEVIRDQGFAHGLPNSSRADADAQWLSRPQLDAAVTEFIDRVKAIGPAAIFDMPQPLDVLFCWAQLGPADQLSEFLAPGIVTDAGFLKAMNSMRGWMSSSGAGVSHPLYRDYVLTFVDADAAKARLERLSE
jgi:hypothetical protein